MSQTVTSHQRMVITLICMLAFCTVVGSRVCSRAVQYLPFDGFDAVAVISDGNLVQPVSVFYPEQVRHRCGLLTTALERIPGALLQLQQAFAVTRMLLLRNLV